MGKRMIGGGSRSIRSSGGIYTLRHPKKLWQEAKRKFVPNKAFMHRYVWTILSIFIFICIAKPLYISIYYDSVPATIISMIPREDLHIVIDTKKVPSGNFRYAYIIEYNDSAHTRDIALGDKTTKNWRLPCTATVALPKDKKHYGELVDIIP